MFCVRCYAEFALQIGVDEYTLLAFHSFKISVIYQTTKELFNCLCGLAVRVPGYRSKGPGYYQAPVIPDFLRSRGSATGSTEPREYN
jgi:hypothetical protein